MSFNYIVSELPPHEKCVFAYTHDASITQTVDRVCRLVSDLRKQGSTRPINLVGHSLGGVVAAAVAQRSDLRGGRLVTISAPFGGSKVAALMRWMMPAQVFDDIHPSSPLMLAVRDGPCVPETLSLVSTAGGTTLMPEDNDGVVSVASQTSLAWPTYLRLRVNHFESLLSDEVLDLLSGHIFQD